MIRVDLTVEDGGRALGRTDRHLFRVALLRPWFRSVQMPGPDVRPIIAVGTGGRFIGFAITVAVGKCCPRRSPRR